MLKAEQIPMEVQDALNKAHGFIISPQALAAAINAWPGIAPFSFYTADGPRDGFILPLTQENTND